ncbi:MAG: FBP domain-containing protein [Candidatus Saccharimonas sp.]
MLPINRDAFALLVKSSPAKLRLRKTLRFVPEEVTNWELRDFLIVTDKSGREGVLLYGEEVVPFTLHPRTAKSSGRVEAIICDICATWRRGTESATITFQAGDRRSVSHLVCTDLDCSLHVRGLTDASVLSRSQLREDITPDARVARLHMRLKAIIGNL